MVRVVGDAFPLTGQGEPVLALSLPGQGVAEQPEPLHSCLLPTGDACAGGEL